MPAPCQHSMGQCVCEGNGDEIDKCWDREMRRPALRFFRGGGRDSAFMRPFGSAGGATASACRRARRKLADGVANPALEQAEAEACPALGETQHQLSSHWGEINRSCNRAMHSMRVPAAHAAGRFAAALFLDMAKFCEYIGVTLYTMALVSESMSSCKAMMGVVSLQRACAQDFCPIKSLVSV
eukprot:3123047-Amphidinium_carterae.1